MHEAKLAKMEAEMKMVFQQKVQEKEAKLKQSEEELYARHREMKEALEKQRLDLEDKKRRIESGRPLTPEKQSVSPTTYLLHVACSSLLSLTDWQEEELPPRIRVHLWCILSHLWFRLLCLGVALLSSSYSPLTCPAYTVHLRFL